MLFLGHFVVVNWSEQLAVMQVMELLFSFHLPWSCVCTYASVCVESQKGDPAGCGKEAQQEGIQPDDGQSEGNIKSARVWELNWCELLPPTATAPFTCHF